MTKENLFPLMLFGTAMMFMLTATIVAVILIGKQRIRQLKLQEQKNRLKHESDLLQSRLQTQEDVLDWLSRELHDNICQLLKLVSTQLSALAIQEPSQQHILHQAEDTISRTLRGVRDLAHKANGERIKKLGLIKAIDEELSYLRTLKDIRCTFKYPDTLPSFDAKKELQIFRILQEVISNILRHSHAYEVEVYIRYTGQTFHLQITDNGTGWPAAESGLKEGMGLADMKKRAGMLEGDLKISSGPQGGVRIQLIIHPLNPQSWKP